MTVRGVSGTSSVHQKVKGAPGVSTGSRGTSGVSRWGGQGESRGSKVLRGKSGVYHGVKAVARGFQGVSGGPRGRQGYPGGSMGLEVSQGVKRGVRGVTRVKGGRGVPGGQEGCKG